MENELVKRRIDIISAHFAPIDEISTNHLLPLNCSGSLNSVLRRRCDNKVYFARQASASFGYFMRQASVEEGDSTSFTAPKTNGAKSDAPSNARAPCFARPAKKDSTFSNSFLQPMAEVQSFDYSTLEPPSFARPSIKNQQRDHLNDDKEKICYSDAVNSEKSEWAPRMDVAESESKYVIMVEVPGVSINDTRVEVDDKKLSVKGKRSTSSWKMAGCPNASFSSYHKREILYGPYEVVWPLPAGVNKHNISAEFLDGFLQIIVPKV